jgi:prepilin-type N-terminal cleavage/methylation domain-containing protein/prepilin-type processing-associated H-X9-DG protein
MKRDRSSGSLAGFTLVELLVVIAIIGILVALLLPAVQAAREAARRTQCVNNFKQSGIALHGYHTTFKHFPSGVLMWDKSARGRANCGAPIGVTTGYYGPGWQFFILPFLEETGLYDRFYLDQKSGTSYASPGNFEAAAEFIDAFLCPSDPQGKELVFCCSTISNGGGIKDDLAKTSHAGVADSRDWSCDGYWPRRDADGILFQGSEISTNKITDGTSHTLMAGELVGSGPGTNDGYFWVSWNVLHTRNGINLPLQIPPSGAWVLDETGFSSYHPGGCNFVLGDGSVQFISESIDQAVLSAMTTRAADDVVQGGI